MTAAERELLLYCARLDDGLLPLTYAQYLSLKETGPEQNERISRLSLRGDYLDACLAGWAARGIEICTLLSPDYPEPLCRKLKSEAPPVLFLLGERALLTQSGISLVGSRNLREPNRAFAERVGRLAAESGKVLISGNARGADQTAQNAGLSAGGGVISYIADSLLEKHPASQLLFVSECAPELRFSSLRALARNRLIHAAGEKVYVAQVTDGSGGTWSGTMKNLSRGWSPVFVFDDGTSGAAALLEAGANPASLADL